MVIVGSSVVFGKVITHSFPVFLASGLRFAIAALILVPLIIKREGGLPDFSKADLGKLSLMAFSGQFLFTVFLLWGLRLTSAAEAGLITSTTPAAMVMVSILVLKEKPSFYQFAGVALALMGILAINGLEYNNYSENISYRWLGNLLICCAVMGEAVFLLLRKTMPLGFSPLTISGALCVLGLVMFAPFAIYQGLAYDFSAPNTIDWLAIFYFGAVFTVVAYILWFRGVVHVSGSTAGVFTAMIPLSALSLSALFLGESITLSHLVGGVLIIGAILLISLSPSPKKEQLTKNCRIS
jgi:drug/metabolite transporter (DMT)-like permease